ncbi:Oidioi.mRNA.OKI2018_I69.chr1.g3218.t1.cds [Oikopleura dioica]|uniref:Oidioi.mRNA.OKI2018_I69.chr1.g3218.t1.cds n=1 Tax=Oikopleura dioica TaxID=34765 RepID=A0ABN7SYX1_OIKDI|nr:Oidioi.mRNA.OKI2018_I69.chr1.g3218.t1.cds [Oikopleura dioica]
MGNSNSAPPVEDVDQIKKDTKLPVQKIKTLWHRFVDLDKTKKGYLSREDLSKIPAFALNPLAERIIDLFLPPDGPQHCSFDRFCFVLAHFQPTRPDTEENDLNSAYHKAKLMFEVFDGDGNGKISMEEVLKILRQMVGSNIGDDQLAQIAKRVVYESVNDESRYSPNEMPSVEMDDFLKTMDLKTIEYKMSVKF